MVPVVSLPQVVPKDRDTLSRILLNAPTMLWKVSTERVKKLAAVKRLVPRNEIFLFLVFRPSEMSPARQVERFGCADATEGFIENDLV